MFVCLQLWTPTSCVSAVFKVESAFVLKELQVEAKINQIDLFISNYYLFSTVYQQLGKFFNWVDYSYNSIVKIFLSLFKYFRFNFEIKIIPIRNDCL